MMSDTSIETPTFITKLRGRWPDAFCWPPKPLALHVHEDIFAAMFPRDAADPAWRQYPQARVISAALGNWCNTDEYLRACTTPNAPRYALSGQERGKVDHVQARYAQDELARRALYPSGRRPLSDVRLIEADHPYLRLLPTGIFPTQEGRWKVKFRDFFGLKSEAGDFETEFDAAAFIDALKINRRIQLYDHDQHDFDEADAFWRGLDNKDTSDPKRKRKDRVT